MTPFSVPQTMHESSSGCSTSIPSVCYWHWQSPVSLFQRPAQVFPHSGKDIHSIYIGNGQPACPSATTEKSYAPTSASSSFLGKYCVDLTEDAANKLHPVINRDRENRMVMEILGSRSKSNVLIVGDAGVGKTALVYGLAWEIVSHKVPSFLEETRVFELDNASLIAGATYKGEIEDRLKTS